MIDTLIEEIGPMVDGELARAQKEHGDSFHTPHEAYAVLREEIEELKDEVDSIINELLLKDERQYGSLWEQTKTFDPSQIACVKLLECTYKDAFMAAMRAAAEAMQVAAVAKKALDSMEIW